MFFSIRSDKIRLHLRKSRKELVHSQLRIKELERDNEQFQLEVHEKVGALAT